MRGSSIRILRARYPQHHVVNTTYQQFELLAMFVVEAFVLVLAIETNAVNVGCTKLHSKNAQWCFECFV